MIDGYTMQAERKKVRSLKSFTFKLLTAPSLNELFDQIREEVVVDESFDGPIVSVEINANFTFDDDYDTSFDIDVVQERDETDDELGARREKLREMAALEAERKARVLLESERRKAAKESLERSEYERLKKKFEPNI